MKIRELNKKEEKKWYKLWWVILIAIGLLLWSFGFLSNPFSGESELKRDYEVKWFFCNSDTSSVEMTSLGNRQDQVTTGLIYLYEDCPDLSEYSVSILEPTKECFYSFNGEVTRLWYESIRQDSFPIPEESQIIIESDIGFSLWKLLARSSYEFEIENGSSEMTLQQQMLSSAYKNYLENGITRSTLYSVIDYEIDNQYNCE